MARRVVSFKIDEDLLFQLEEFARKRGLSKSEVIRRAILEYINERPDLKPYIGRRMKIYS